MTNHKELCSIIILSYNQVHYTKQCLESIRKYTTTPYEVIVIDNASNEETVAYLEEQDDIILIKNKVNQGFAGGCNQGMELAKGNYIMLLNNDTIVTKDWLDNMVKLMESDPEIAMVGPLTNSTVGKQMIKVPYGEDMNAMHLFAEKIALSNVKPWRTLRLVAFCVLIRRSLIEEIGMLDEAFRIGNYEDDDYNIRALLAGKKSYICRNSFIHHFMNISFHKNNLPREQIMHKNKMLLEEKWEHMDWNHHAAFNNWMLQKMLEQDGHEVLHLGCGLGSLSIELKDANPACHVVGVEDHPIRRKIAESFVDNIISWDRELEFFVQIPVKKYSSIIIEGMLEKSGLELLNRLQPYMDENTNIYLRVFNIKHISTVERLITGKVEGDLLCASSNEFKYYYDKSLCSLLEAEGYKVLKEVEVKKSLSILQEAFVEKLGEYEEFSSESRVYNRIYQIKKI